MKKSLSLIVFISLISSFLFIGSCENNNQITNSNQQSLESIDQQLDELEKNVNDLTRSVNAASKDPQYCGNANFPESSEITNPMTYAECEGDKDKTVTSTFVAHLWANYAPRFQRLYWRACGKPQYPGIPHITGLVKFQQNNHPHFTWNFRHSHYYIIQRSFGNNNNWVDIGTNDNCWDGEWNHPGDDCGSNESLKFTDWGVNLNTITQNVYYRVLVKIFNYVSLGGPEIVYSPLSLTVNINGPTQLLSGQSGTFIANIGDGVPPYTYSWKKYQYCNDRSQSNDTAKDDGTRSVPCGFWESIPGNTSTVYVSGSFPEFQLKVTVTAQNGSATDYHLVTVSLP